MPVVIATITPLPQHRSAVREALLAAVTQVHGEDGCELYALHENHDSFVMIERWTTPQALKVHSAGPALAALAAQLEGRTSGDLQVVVVEPVPGGDLARGEVTGAVSP